MSTSKMKDKLLYIAKNITLEPLIALYMLSFGLDIALRAPWSSDAIDAWLENVVPEFR